MTKQEAIKVLKKDLKIIDDPKVTMTAREWEEHDDHMRDALEMAIEALEKEETLQNLTKPNKSDLISRQAAIDAVTEAIWHYPNECYKNLNVYEVAEVIVSDAIKSLPSADRPTGHWIENDNGTFSCSNCQSWIPKEQHHYARHCLYCGARMESDEQ